jgi:hypothetical protein
MNSVLGVSLDGAVFPLFRIRRGPPRRVLAAAGTGFLIADGVVLTCWHCVAGPLEDDETYAAAVWNGNAYLVKELSDVSQTATGHDLAVASVDLHPLADLRLSSRGLTSGDDVWTFGFPHTRVSAKENGQLSFQLEGRYLQGYVTRGFLHDQPGFRRTPSYELDMPAPAGLSGAPLFKLNTLEVVGVVYGANETGSIVQMAEEDPETGERTPYIERILAFGLAHQEFTLHGVQGPATGGRRLGEMVRLGRDQGESESDPA